MDNQKLEILLNRLITLTEKGLADWKTTGSEETFLLVLKDSSISISTELSEDLDEDYYILQFRNDKGETVQNTYLSEDNSYYKSAEWLYELVRRKGLNADSIIDSIIEQLNPDSIAA